MTMEYKSNYEKVTEDWKKRFLDMDQERLIAYIRKGSVCRQRRNTGI